MRIAFLAFGAVLAMATMAGPATAEVTQGDLLVAARAIDFVDSVPHGDVRVGIVYDPNVALSSQQANELNALMGSGLRVGNLTLIPFMVPAGQLNGDKAGALFLTEGAGAIAGKVGRAIRQRKIPCVTFDLGQVRNGNCVIGVRTQPKIQVFVNHAAADASGTVLEAVFRIMITEI